MPKTEPLHINSAPVRAENHWTASLGSLDRTPPTGARVPQSVEVDILIVGAGYSGLSCAIHFLENAPDLRIALVEKDSAGFGASGRNAGMVEPGLLGMTWTLPGAVESETDARWAFNAARNRLERLLTEMAARDIDGDLVACANVISARTSLARAVAQTLGERLSGFGLETTWVGSQEAEARFGTRGEGALVYRGYSVHPGKLAHALREMALKMGASLFEGDAVVELTESGEKVVARTESGGRVTAAGCLVASGAWAGELGIMTRTAPEIVHTWMFATEQLPPDLLAKAGSDQAALVAELTTSKEVSYRRIHDGRILFGSYDEPGHAVDAGVDQHMLDRLHSAALDAMPYLKGVRIERVWGGPIFGMAHDLPFIEVVPGLPNTAIVAPNGSSGVPWALLAGGMVSGILLDGPTGDAEGERLRNILNETRMPWATVGGMLVRAIWNAYGLGGGHRAERKAG